MSGQLTDTAVGRFKIEGGALYGPATYMREQGDAKLDGILAGRDVVFNMTSHLSPNIETAILVAMQTDYAGWLGARHLLDMLDGGGAQESPRWDGAWQLDLREGEGKRTASMREGEEGGFVGNGWRVTGRTPRLTTDAEAARAAAFGWEVSAATGNAFHRTLRVPAHTPEAEAARSLADYRQETLVFGELNYSARPPA